MQIAIIGKEDFCLGFRLAGIDKIFETENPMDAIRAAKEDTGIGVVVFDENLMEKMDEDEKQELEDSIQPVYLTVSRNAAQDNLKKMIRKSIGVEM